MVERETSMAEEFQTFREVGFGIGKVETAIKGIGDQLSLMQKVFIGAAGVAVVCFGYLFVTTTTTSNVVAGLDERTKAMKEDVGNIKDDIRAMRTTLDGIKAGVAANASGIEKLLSNISANPEKASGLTPLLVGKWKGFYIDDLENFAVTVGKYQMVGQGLLFSEDPKIIKTLGGLGLEPYKGPRK